MTHAKATASTPTLMRDVRLPMITASSAMSDSTAGLISGDRWQQVFLDFAECGAWQAVHPHERARDFE